MRGIVDFHSHILPGVDDGSRNVEESLRMLRMEAEQGVCHVVATPHFYANQDTPGRFLERRAAAWAELQEAMAGADGLPAVTLGAEVLYFPGISECEALSRLTIGQNRYIMLEMKSVPWSQSVYREIQAIYDHWGITPIIAHIDRYIRPFRTYGIPQKLEGLPVLIQANASFFLHASTASMAMRMLKNGQIHLLGSDCHDTQVRKPNLGEAVQRIERRNGKAFLERNRGFEDAVLL